MGMFRGVGLAILVAAGVACSSATSERSLGTAGTGAPPAAPSTQAVPTANPDAKYGSNCDMDLNSNYNTSVTGWLVADAELHNTGNIGLVVVVDASWKRAGTVPLRQSKKVELPYHHSRAVHFKVPVDQNTVDAVQSAPGYLGGGGWCHVVAKIVNTMGQPHAS